MPKLFNFNQFSLLLFDLPRGPTLRQYPACLVLGWFVRWDVSGHTTAVLKGVVSWICSEKCFLGSYHLAFSLRVSVGSMRCIHTVLQMQPQFGRNPVLFYWIDHISIWSLIGLRTWLRARAMKGYSAFPKAPALLEPHHQIV